MGRSVLRIQHSDVVSAGWVWFVLNRGEDAESRSAVGPAYTGPVLHDLIDDLAVHHGLLDDWWPAETRFEIMIGSVLTQRTRWENAAVSLDRLRGRGLLHPDALADTDPDILIDLIRPSGFVRSKSRACRAVATWTRDHRLADVVLAPPLDRSASAGAVSPPRSTASLPDYSRSSGGVPFPRHAVQPLRRPVPGPSLSASRIPSAGSTPERAGASPVPSRGQLLSVYGVGPETADAQLLFAFDQPVFIADAYAHQVFAARGLPAPAGYGAMRDRWQPVLEQEGLDPVAAQRLHALIVEEGSRLAGR